MSVSVVISHYNEDLSWVTNLNYPFTVISNHSIPNETFPNKGNEASGYLKYIITNYDFLSDYTVFVHAHRTAWHNNNQNIDDIINNLTFNKNYFNLKTDGYISKIILNEYKLLINYYDEFEVLTKTRIIPDKIKFYNCAQFYVHKDLIQSHTKNQYKYIYDWIKSIKLNSYDTGQIFEVLWNLIFTGNDVEEFKEIL